MMSTPATSCALWQRVVVVVVVDVFQSAKTNAPCCWNSCGCSSQQRATREVSPCIYILVECVMMMMMMMLMLMMMSWSVQLVDRMEVKSGGAVVAVYVCFLCGHPLC